MKDKRLPGLSLLDYLWTTYKYYSVSSQLEDNPDEYIPTLSLITELLKDIETPLIDLFEVVDSLPIVGQSNKIYLLLSGDNYSAYVYVNNVAILIGSTGSDIELTNKVDALTADIDNLKNKLNWIEY